ncbi:MAG: hypothetical protein OQJ89_03415 [Kangiellaceae bacterium]|nr:hypothetical protein [Kangiellaceae bacterium]MCW8999300.1 hypothetical protein [Kangiellaceae bacterium]MCW9015986.1 hypothetical protein [Kangiellaceae bacterium]
MIDDFVGGIAKLIGRVIYQIFIEIILEIIIKGPGYILYKLVKGQEPDPDGISVFILGMLFWVLMGYGVYLVIR